MEKLALPALRNLRGSLRTPGSKSIANRAFPLAAMARGTTLLTHVPDGEDVRLMRAALESLGVAMEEVPGGLRVHGCGTGLREANPAHLHLGNSGTASRFLTALLCAGEGEFVIDGIPRLRERPIGPLIEALRGWTAPDTLRYEGREGYPPLRIRAAGLAGGETRISGAVSSQFTTALLLALPLCRGAASVKVEGELVSAPYVALTLDVQEAFGARPERDGNRRFWVTSPQGYHSPGEYAVEPDASSASYFLAAAAIGGGPVTLEGLHAASLQGEARFAEALQAMGARVAWNRDSITVAGPADGGRLRGIDIDMDRMSDTGMTLAVTALFAEGATCIRNVGNWRVKETDRLAAMAAELAKTGAGVEEGPDFLRIEPPTALRPATVATYDDHRMAMAFSLLALAGPGSIILDPGCTGKTYPGYFEDFFRLGVPREGTA